MAEFAGIPAETAAIHGTGSDQTRWNGPRGGLRLPPRRRLRFRVAAGVALGLATLLSVFVALMAWAVQLSTDAVYHERLVMARTTARSVDDLMGQALHQIQALAVEVVWDQQREEPLPEQPLLARLVHVSGTFESLEVTDRYGRMIWNWGPSEDLSALETARSNGVLKADTGPRLSASSLPSEHPPIALATTPLRNAGGEIAGALAGTLHLAHMGVELVPIPSKETGLLVEMVDTDGRILRSTDGGDVSRLATEHQHLLAASLKSGKEGVTLHEVPGEDPHLVAFAPFQRLPGGVFVEEQDDVALMVPRQFRRVGIFVGSTALLLTSLGAWWYASRITRPLEELAAAAQTIAGGSFDSPVSARSVDELGMLAGSFEEMRVRLKGDFEDRLRWEEQLEQQVKERTEAVHQLLEKLISAQEDERKRIARELHDGAAQDLAALLVALDTFEAGPLIGAAQAGLVQRIRQEAREALQEIRRLLLDLRPSALDDLGLAPAVRWYVDTRLSGSGIDRTVTVQGQERRLPPALETTLFRIVQEAVNNAAKHSEPHKVDVVLDFTGPAVVAVIEDDGKGFDPASYNNGHSGAALGLAGMRERAELAGGSLEVVSRTGHGTRITAAIPVVEEADGGAN